MYLGASKLGTLLTILILVRRLRVHCVAACNGFAVFHPFRHNPLLVFQLDNSSRDVPPCMLTFRGYKDCNVHGVSITVPLKFSHPTFHVCLQHLYYLVITGGDLLSKVFSQSCVRHSHAYVEQENCSEHTNMLIFATHI